MIRRLFGIILFIPIMCITAIIAMFFVLLTPFVALAMYIVAGEVDLQPYADFSESITFYILDNFY
jgi:hypothetical protein